jgi:uncharacterized membrane protein YphA (DoxX/SURF4 family)
VFELEAPVEESRARVAIRSALRFLPRLGVAALFLAIGYTKFDNDPKGEWVEIFERIGFGQWFRYFTGAIQMSGGILMLFRRTLTIGAAMLAATMLGAAIVDAIILGSPLLIIPLMLLFLVATVWVTSA